MLLLTLVVAALQVLAIVVMAVPLYTFAAQAPPSATVPIPDPKSAIVPRMDVQVKIDGALDEQAWQKAARLAPFVQHEVPHFWEVESGKTVNDMTVRLGKKQ